MPDTLTELSRLIRTREASPVEIARDVLTRIEQRNPALNAYLLTTPELAMSQAEQAEREIASGQYRGRLHGIPYAAKDLMYTRGIPTTAGTKIFADFVPAYDATVVEKLRDAGAVLLGKAHLHENAYGITSNNAHYGPVRNPWNLDHIPGGSSGGSTSALAAGLCAFSLGTDTGGSIRIPAAFCGVTGLKPTFGRISRHGMFLLGESLDTIGPFAWTAQETAWIYSAMAGPDPADDTTLDADVELPEFAAEPRLEGVRLGVPGNFYFENLDSGVDAACGAALQVFTDLGAELVPVRVPDISEINELHRLILFVEGAAVHQKTFAERREDYGEDQRPLFDQGLEIRAVDYFAAERRRQEFTAEMEAVLDDVDALLAPAVVVPPAPIGSATLDLNGVETDVRAATTRNSRGLNLTGLPILTLPCGFTNGLPVGLQVVGPQLAESQVLQIGHAYQSVTTWHDQRPQEG